MFSHSLLLNNVVLPHNENYGARNYNTTSIFQNPNKIHKNTRDSSLARENDKVFL